MSAPFFVSWHRLQIRHLHDFFDLNPEQLVVVLIDSVTLRKAERLIESCESCNEEGAEIPFDAVLDRRMASDPTVTDYILDTPAKCPNCRSEILEKTLVEPKMKWLWLITAALSQSIAGSIVLMGVEYYVDTMKRYRHTDGSAGTVVTVDPV